jgi:choline dehydrogenase-like flavoprotein
MTNLNTKVKKRNKFDVIVIGSGISGGWAAKEFCDAGLKTLVLERGRDVKHAVDYPTTNMEPWEFDHLGQIPKKLKDENPIASKCYIFTEEAQHFVVKDKEHPYIQEKPFDWIRGYQVGGKSLLWARGTQRWSKYDFDGPSRDGFDVKWPIGYDDLAPWYSHVEIFAGISGNKDGLETLPDGEFLKPLEQTCVEKYFSEEMAKHYIGNRPVIVSRCAHLTDPQPIHYQQGRARCQQRNLCERGCPYGGYFSSNASTLPWAMRTGNMTLRPNSVVYSIIYDEKTSKASGVNVVDSITKKEKKFYAKVIFVNASTINTNLILLNSKSARFPNGLSNDNGLMGKYIHFHSFITGMTAEYDGFQDSITAGTTPGGSYIPRFRNVKKQETNFLRGYAAGFSARRPPLTDTSGLGRNLIDNLRKKEYGNWQIGSHFMGETIPKVTNYVKLDEEKKDDWGIPLVRLSVELDDNDLKMAKDYEEQMTEMFTIAGFKNIKSRRKDNWNPGLDIHEMGGVLMGDDPKTSQLNKWNQLHHCKNVFVTDGACMTSNSTQNPSLTYMAMTARAANFAIEELKKGNL